MNDDDWRWALRSMANRPILRLSGDSPLIVVQTTEDASDGRLKARVSFISSMTANSVSGRELDTNFHVEQSIFGKRGSAPAKWSLNGELGAAANPNAIIRAAYSREMPDGSFPEIASQPGTSPRSTQISPPSRRWPCLSLTP